MKKILITGANSYIGESFKRYMEKFPNDYSISILDTKGLVPTPNLFNNYDVVFCVTGVAHIKETEENRGLFFEINRDLVVNIANSARNAGVKQFILLSSMSVYGLDTGYITKDTEPNPKSAYGESKLQADDLIGKLQTKDFIFTCLRPPMVYGPGCKGNYQRLRSFALKSPIFPKYDNQRSMIFIENLCEFVKKSIDEEMAGVFFPQNSKYVTTSEIVKQIAISNNKRIILTQVFNKAIEIAPFSIVKKVFGDLKYEPVDLVEAIDFIESIKMTEE